MLAFALVVNMTVVAILSTRLQRARKEALAAYERGRDDEERSSLFVKTYLAEQHDPRPLYEQVVDMMGLDPILERDMRTVRDREQRLRELLTGFPLSG